MTASAAFLSSLLECTLFLVGRILGSQGSILVEEDASITPRGHATELLKEQIKRVWEELCSGHLKVEESVAAMSVAKFLADLYKNDSGKHDVPFVSSMEGSYLSQRCLMQLGTVLFQSFVSRCTPLYPFLP